MREIFVEIEKNLWEVVFTIFKGMSKHLLFSNTKIKAL